jgi:hypothetical protein
VGVQIQPRVADGPCLFGDELDVDSANVSGVLRRSGVKEAIVPAEGGVALLEIVEKASRATAG